MADELFNVFQFFVDGSQEKVAELVPARQAVETVRNLITSLGAQMGTTKRVIITDTGDLTNLEWVYGLGITYPVQEE